MTNKISIADILREGFEATKKNANSVLPLFVGAQALVFLLQYLLNLSFLNILMIPVVLFMHLAIFRSFKHSYTKFDINEILSLKDKDLKPTLSKLFITYVIYIVLLILLFLLLVIPGIIFMVYWYLFAYIVLDQGLSGMAALKKSREMIKGNWWKTFAFVVIGAVLTGIASSIISSISSGNLFISGLLTAITSGIVSVYFGYVAVAYYFSLKK
jgi:uncharacterized membrane protein